MAHNQNALLFLEKVFLRPRTDPVRGVELFNLNLLRDLVDLCDHVTVPIHTSWGNTVRKHLHDCSRQACIVECVFGQSSLSNGLAAVARLWRRRFDVVLLANVANSLLPALRLAAWRRLAQRYVLIAHREPSPRFVRACSRLPISIDAVNSKIAGHFSNAHFPSVNVWYGITDADKYFPKPQRNSADTPFRFCVLGHLDNPWKGADTAVDAFRALPSAVRAGTELHLASFARPPSFPEPSIHAYSWMDASQVPDFLRSMHAMLVPSRDEQVMRETFSQAMVQGMLTGLPICVNDLPILTEKLDRGGGMVFDSTEQLVAHMQRLAGNPAECRKLGAQGRRTALDRYVWNSTAFVERFVADGSAPHVHTTCTNPSH